MAATYNPCDGVLNAAAPLVVSFGSSYSAGYGLYKSSGGLLADMLASDAGLTKPYNNYANCSMSGSELPDVPNHTILLKEMSFKAALITSGGNDLQYVLCLDSPTTASCGSTISELEYKTRYKTALDSIRNHTSSTTPIYVVDYIHALGNHVTCNGKNPCNLTPTQEATAEVLYQKTVNWTLSAYSEWKGKNTNRVLKLIPMRQYSTNLHDVGTSVPWISGSTPPAPNDGAIWHPNAAGAQFIAQAVYNDLKGMGPPPY